MAISNNECLISSYGRCEKVEEKLRKPIELNPKLEVIYWACGECLRKKGRYEDAIAFFEKYTPNSKNCLVTHSYGVYLMEVERYDDALKQFEKMTDFEPEYYPVYLSYAQLMEKKDDKEDAIMAYLKHIKLCPNIFREDFDFQEIYSEHIAPLVSKLKLSKYIEQFFESEKKEPATLKLNILLVLLGQYDIIRDYIQDIFGEYPDRKGKDKREFELLIFTIKLSIWLKLINEHLNDALKSNELYIEYIKALKTIKERENEVLNFSLDLFSIQIKYNIKAENVRNVLKRLEDVEEIPFSNVIYKVWTCLSEPDSVEAQRYLNEKPIAEVVKQLKARVKSQKGDKKLSVPKPKR